MEQLRQVGEAIGSLNAYKVFQDEIQINQRQCCLLIDAFNLAFDVITDEIKQHLSYDENRIKWKELENPLKELHRVIKEGEYYVKKCLEPKSWWVKALSLNLNTDCVDFHLHNLLWCLFIVVEAIENVGEISGQDTDTIQWKITAFWKKYEQSWMEPKLFFHRFAKLYLVSQEMCSSFNSVGKEDRWLLTEQISEKETSIALKTHESQVAELLLAPRDTLHPMSMILESKKFQQGRRLGNGSQYKEAEWMGESFALHHCFSDLNSMSPEISLLTSVMHPNVLNYMYAFSDEARVEYYVLMELMNKNLLKYIGEVSSARRRIPFPLHVAVDIMLQIARGMEYLHSKKLYHGDLKPTNILVKARSPPSDGYLHAKITGFGKSSNKNKWHSQKSTMQTDKNHWIWNAPEVLREQEQFSTSQSARFTEKADVYSFAMICFQLLTGKIPFDDDHMQGENVIRNIKEGLRPLFTPDPPKFLSNLTKKCWHSDPSQRPSFSSICRVLRYTKRLLIKNPDVNLNPPVDYFDIEMSLLTKFESWTTAEEARVSEVPWQMFCYSVLERQRMGKNPLEKPSETESEQKSACGDEAALQRLIQEKVSKADILTKSSSLTKLDMEPKSPTPRSPGTPRQKPKETPRRQPQALIRERSQKKIAESPLRKSSSARRTSSDSLSTEADAP
ncbi:mitogen-activated protein kinase kinase kinase 13-B-like isoform X2 [Phalaenopsis equestris]|uniref:mitogen-activated protein kinase kinase kinase 13-B-like isoform X2 n=1 Tax=Phalaenopsis equestris TaxID=78828 RepID=UPI0009E259AE|nr:mitogen-activated protein kinase kinase kinase 13-B-like isoform X2 [Phalaenopsis equestris]